MPVVLDEDRYHARVGENLRHLRETFPMSQVALAAESGVALRVISKLENGGGGLRVITAARLARALGVDLATLLGEPA